MSNNLKNLAAMMAEHSVEKLYAKILSDNDNSKNQVYLGGGFSALNLLPHYEIETDDSKLAGSVRDRAKAGINFFWLGENGIHKAPKAQLILYPKYPEVRMSGFLVGCSEAPSDLMRQRLRGRVLFFGVTVDDRIVGYVSPPEAELTNEFLAFNFQTAGVFSDLTYLLTSTDDTRKELLNKLCDISEMGWIPSQRLSPSGFPKPYQAPNGGGYTLEAMLGITPNGFAGPDFMGWEVKQYSVNNFESCVARTPVTIFTPEPAGGVYKVSGVEQFIRRYGYADRQDRDSRLNFGGIYRSGANYHHRTQLGLNIEGYDSTTQKITDMNGQVTLRHKSGELAAAWPFSKLMKHWKKKHAKAVYIPSITRLNPPEYQYGPKVELHQGTDFLLFLRGLSAGDVFLDPALKLETGKEGIIRIKRRNQFRIRHKNLTELYQQSELVKLNQTEPHLL